LNIIFWCSCSISLFFFYCEFISLPFEKTCWLSSLFISSPSILLDFFKTKVAFCTSIPLLKYYIPVIFLITLHQSKNIEITSHYISLKTLNYTTSHYTSLKEWGWTARIAIARHAIARHFLQENNCSTQILSTARIQLILAKPDSSKWQKKWQLLDTVEQLTLIFFATVKCKSSILFI
jgi:hypothetical protein